ncbi:MAG: radical SAM protein [Euryarchaeota archaeon]|nr:radical SAM protein [Euryarchaeota archaeon]
MIISLFDPWRSSLCTCPKKYSLNPYTGCAHACVYCYITSYIPRAFEARLKRNLLKQVKRELLKLDPRFPVTIANSSDPYQPLERDYKQTRSCLKLLKERGFRVQVVTKGDLVVRDASLLAEMHAAVAVTVTTLHEGTAAQLEPGAPSPERRLRALQELAERGIPVACRIDPLIPGVNDSAGELVRELAHIGVCHVVSSTFKPRPDSWRRFAEAFPEAAEKLRELYFRRGSRVQNSYYLPREVRLELLRRVRDACRRYGISFATCREGLKLNTAPSCDGTHLLRLHAGDVEHAQGS